MDLTTRCPRCETVFQASLADLQLRKGYIRCVQCAHIFDGYAEVVSDDGSEPFLETSSLDQAISGPDEPALGHAYNTSEFGETGPNHRIRHDASTDDGPEFQIVDTNSINEDEKFSITMGSRHRAAQAESFILEADPDRRTSAGSVYHHQVSGFRQAVGKLFAWLILVLLILFLVLQGAFIYRAQIAQNFPFTRPLLEKYCSYLDCYVPYLRDIDSLVITKSALKLIKPTNDDAQDTDENTDTNQTDTAETQLRNYELQFDLRNLAKQPQEWPTIVLNLKDSSGQIQIKRNLTPKDYLASISPAMPAQSELFVRLPIQLKGDSQVNGFHLDLFFP